MKAAVFERYGDPEVVHVEEVPSPKVRANAVLVRVKAVAVTSGDARIRAASFPSGFAVPARLVFGIFRPRQPILGGSFSGIVEAVGADVPSTQFAVGDEVCGMAGAKMGAHAEFVAVPARKLARKPPEVSHEDAAGLLFGGSTALYFLRDKASIAPGTTVLVNGAAGAIGTNAVQLAKHFGATVTAVTSTANAALAIDLGADRVIDYSTTDLGATTDRFDVVLDTVGNLSIDVGKSLLTPSGILLLPVAGLGDTIRARGNVAAGTSRERADDFDLLLQLVATGQIKVVTDQIYDLDDIVAAYRRVDTGHKVGNVVVRL